MTEQAPTGTRLRNRRLDLGLRQADVAQQVGISASYLNLIEHNRRRIGSHLLGVLAKVLQVDEAALQQGSDAALLAPLQAAAADFSGARTGSADDLIARFPDWAQVIAAQSARIAQLEARTQALSDRLAHDTQIAGSLHEVISTATAIRSTASILAETPDLDAEWRARFHGNIDTDSARLAESSQALLGFLDMEVEAGGDAEPTPVEAADAVMAAWGHYVPEAETQDQPDLSHVPDAHTRQILQDWIARAGRDAADLPLASFEQAARAVAYDPARLAARFGVPLDQVLRRLAHLPDGVGHPPMGVADCDAAGVVTFQKPVLDFRLARAGAACPLWPLFQALTQPGRAIARRVRMPGAARTTFECFAFARPVGTVAFDAEPRIVATMLVRPAKGAQSRQAFGAAFGAGQAAPADHADAADQTGHVGQVGPGCRLCPVQACDARRHPSLLASTPAGLT